MTDQSRFEPYDRKAYLATVPENDRATAERLCKMLEKVYSKKEIQLYSGFPIVVRDGEWLAGFAIRAKCPMIYCCSPGTMKVMGKELAPLMSGKSCYELRAKKGLTLEDAYELTARAFALSSKGPGSISETDRRKRDAAKRAAAATKKPAPSKKKTTVRKKATAKKKAAAKKKTASEKKSTATRKPAAPKKETAKKKTAKKTATKK